MREAMDCIGANQRGSDGEGMTVVELEFDVSADEDGVISGLELARKMIRDAYKLLVPYVNACPACADSLFGAMANAEIAALHKQRGQKAPLPSIILSRLPDGPEKDAAIRRHLAAHKARISLLIEPAHGEH